MQIRILSFLSLTALSLTLFSCGNDAPKEETKAPVKTNLNQKLFKFLTPEETGINFRNDFTFDTELLFYKYQYNSDWSMTHLYCDLPPALLEFWASRLCPVLGSLDASVHSGYHTVHWPTLESSRKSIHIWKYQAWLSFSKVVIDITQPTLSDLPCSKPMCSNRVEKKQSASCLLVAKGFPVTTIIWSTVSAKIYQMQLVCRVSGLPDLFRSP